MAETPPTATPGTVRNISDTARWAAYFRAEETRRPDALLRDPFAERLCGQHGVDIPNTPPDGSVLGLGHADLPLRPFHPPRNSSRASTWC